MIQVDNTMLSLANRIEKVTEYDEPGAVIGLKNADAGTEDKSKYMDLLYLAWRFYSALEPFRRRRTRAVNFYRGRQWSDKVVVNGRTMTEEQYLQMQGKAPLKQNMIRPPMKNLIGQYRSAPSKPVVFARNRDDQKAAEMMSVALDATLFMNDSKSRDARELEEFLISGWAIYRTSFSMDYERNRAIPKFRSVSPNRFFFSSDSEDVMGEDIDLIGEVCDYTLDDLIATYARSKGQEDRLRDIYRNINDRIKDTYRGQSVASHNLNQIDFLAPNDTSKCRVIEIWRKESEWRLYCHDWLDGTMTVRPAGDRELIESENKKRKDLGKRHGMQMPLITYSERFCNFWKCYHLSPTADVIFECESPYEHNSHPFVFCAYPMVDGECWGMVEDLIDQQKMINRNIILFDFINSASAKGVLLVPEESIPDDTDIEEIAEEWTKYNGVIKIKARAGANIPHQIVTNSVHPGLNEMIQMQLNFMQSIGGVHEAIQGQSTGATTPASLYAQQAQNSSLNTLDYIATFNQFLQKRDLKLIQLIQQYFTSKQYIEVAGRSYSEEAKHFDPAKIRDVDFDNAMGASNDTPAYRALMDNTLMQLLQQQQIDIVQYLENCSLVGADKILESIKRQIAERNAQQAQIQAQQTQSGEPQSGERVAEIDPAQQKQIESVIERDRAEAERNAQPQGQRNI